MFALLTITLDQASYEVLYGEYMVRAGRGKEPPDKSTAAIMESILQVRTGELICTHPSGGGRVQGMCPHVNKEGILPKESLGSCPSILPVTPVVI